MAKRQPRSGLNQAKRRIELEKLVAAGVPVPDGVRIRSKKDTRRWAALTAVRAPDDWSDADLLLVAELVARMAERDREDTKLRREGTVLVRDGREVKNPRHAVVTELNKEIRAIRQMLKLHALGHRDQRTVADHGKASRQVRDAQNDEKIALMG